MPRVERTVRSPYPAEALFDIAADIVRYPEFVPGFVSARILDRRAGRDGETLWVEQKVGLAGLALRFVSVARLRRPRSIEIESEKAPFGRIGIEWRFEPGPRRSGTLVRFAIELTLARPWRPGAVLILPVYGSRVARAFARRAVARLDRKRRTVRSRGACSRS
jgi:coenzyme Q-binding protein COQ10